MPTDPYAEFQKPAAGATSNPYAEFAKPASSASPKQPEQPGFLSRFYQNTVGPVADLVGDYSKHVQENQPKYGLASGFPAVAQTLSDVGSGIVGSTSNAVNKTGEALRKGDYIHALQQAPGIVPLVGPSAVQVGEDSEKGNYGGALGGALGLGLSMAAPKIIEGAGRLVRAPAAPIAETALGVRKIDRAYDKTPGRAILDETRGLRPSTIAESARAKVRGLNNQLEGIAANSTEPASLTSALDTLTSAEQTARARNAKTTLRQLIPMRGHLSTDVTTGQPIPNPTTPSQLLNLKRGFKDEFIDNWNPETMSGVKSTAANTYGALDRELDRTVPGAKSINQRISSLIPVSKRAESTDLNANTLQRTLGRVARPTGALTGAVSGAFEGGRHFGPGGAVVGGLVGLGLPELIASPTVQMSVARGLNAVGKGTEAMAPIAGNAARVAPLIKTKQRPQE